MPTTKVVGVTGRGEEPGGAVVAGARHRNAGDVRRTGSRLRERREAGDANGAKALARSGSSRLRRSSPRRVQRICKRSGPGIVIWMTLPGRVIARAADKRPAPDGPLERRHFCLFVLLPPEAAGQPQPGRSATDRRRRGAGEPPATLSDLRSCRSQRRRPGTKGGRGPSSLPLSLSVTPSYAQRARSGFRPCATHVGTPCGPAIPSR